MNFAFINSISRSDAPQLLRSITSTSIESNTNFIHVCAANAGSQPLTFEWRIEGQAIKSSERHVIDDSEQHSLLSIKKVQLAEAGNYTCVVKNAFGSDSYTFSLQVKGICEF